MEEGESSGEPRFPWESQEFDYCARDAEACVAENSQCVNHENGYCCRCEPEYYGNGKVCVENRKFEKKLKENASESELVWQKCDSVAGPGGERRGFSTILPDRVIWFDRHSGHVVAFLDKALYDDYICLVASN